MIKSLDKFINIERKIKKAFLIMIGIDVLIYITRLIFYTTDVTIRYFDDLTELMRNGFLILVLLYLLLLINYRRNFRSVVELKASRYISMVFIILGYILISFLLFILVGLVFTG